MTSVTSDRMQLLECLAARAATTTDKSALRYICHESGTEDSTSYAELHRRSDHAAAILQQRTMLQLPRQRRLAGKRRRRRTMGRE